MAANFYLKKLILGKKGLNLVFLVYNNPKSSELDIASAKKLDKKGNSGIKQMSSKFKSGLKKAIIKVPR